MNGFPSFPYGVSFAGYWDASAGLAPTPPPNDSFWVIIQEGSMRGSFYEEGSCMVYQGGTFSKADGFTTNWQAIVNKPDYATRWVKWGEIPDKPVGTELENNIAIRDSDGDLEARRFKSTAYSQSAIPSGASLSFRVNPNDDNYIRFASRLAVVDWLQTVNDSYHLEGRTIDDITTLARQNVVLNDVTINKKPLTGPVELDAADVGLGNVPNYAATNSASGTSTSLLATQRAAYDAASAPLLADDRKRKITISNLQPSASDGTDGDIWLIY